MSRPLPGTPCNITISRDRAGCYFISCLSEFEPKEMPVIPMRGGIDLGLTKLFVTSESMTSGNPCHFKRYEARLAFLQRRLAKKQEGSLPQAALESGAAGGHKVETLPLSQRR